MSGETLTANEDSSAEAEPIESAPSPERRGVLRKLVGAGVDGGLATIGGGLGGLLSALASEPQRSDGSDETVAFAAPTEVTTRPGHDPCLYTGDIRFGGTNER